MLKRVYSNLKKRVLWHFPRKVVHEYLYHKERGGEINLDNKDSLRNLNEKLQYLIVYKYGEKEGFLADKYKVKDYVNSLKIKDLYVPRTLKVYKDANEINLDELPEKFVLKCNHGSGNVFICTNKNTFNLKKARKVLNKDLKSNFAKKTFEYHYEHIEPVIIAEEYLNDGSGKNPMDYKFYVFGGKCDRVLLCSEREKKLRLDDYDLNWNLLDDTLPEYKSGKKIERPKNLDKMVKIAEELCKKNGKVEIPFARVDLYDIDERIYFGEYTFTPARGLIEYYNERTLRELGDKLDLEWYN